MLREDILAKERFREKKTDGLNLRTLSVKPILKTHSQNLFSKLYCFYEF